MCNDKVERLEQEELQLNTLIAAIRDVLACPICNNEKHYNDAGVLVPTANHACRKRLEDLLP